MRQTVKTALIYGGVPADEPIAGDAERAKYSATPTS
jgi:hypothetical protein